MAKMTFKRRITLWLFSGLLAASVSSAMTVANFRKQVDAQKMALRGRFVNHLQSLRNRHDHAAASDQGVPLPSHATSGTQLHGQPTPLSYPPGYQPRPQGRPSPMTRPTRPNNPRQGYGDNTSPRDYGSPTQDNNNRDRPFSTIFGDPNAQPRGDSTTSGGITY